jgi:hypothetical protein
MGLGLIIDDLCVFIGVVVVWIARRCKYSLWEKLKGVKGGDFWCRSEGIIGLATILALGVTVWVLHKIL